MIIRRWQRTDEKGDLSRMNGACHKLTSHVTHEWVMADMNESCDIWLSHVAEVRMNESHHTERNVSRMNESCNTWTRHITHGQVMSHILSGVCSKNVAQRPHRASHSLERARVRKRPETKQKEFLQQHNVVIVLVNCLPEILWNKKHLMGEKKSLLMKQKEFSRQHNTVFPVINCLM